MGRPTRLSSSARLREKARKCTHLSAWKNNALSPVHSPCPSPVHSPCPSPVHSLLDSPSFSPSRPSWRLDLLLSLPLITLPLFALPACSSHDVDEPASLVLKSGQIYTLDPQNQKVEAMAITDGEIVYVGSNAGAQKRVGSETRVIDLGGQTVLPGFHDTHTHLIWSAADLLNVDLFEATSVEELQATVLAWAESHPEAPWVEGGGWDMSIFDGLLNTALLDEVVPDRPVILYSADGHSAFVNSLALELAGINANTPNPEDGIIVKDESGQPTGILQESAMDLVAVLVPVYPDEQIDEGLKNGLTEANMFGITTLIDASVFDEWLLKGYARAEQNNALTVRVFGTATVEPGDSDALSKIEGWRTTYASDLITVNAIKFFIDGIIESETAYMLSPYTDGTNGTPNFSDEELESAVNAFDAAGFQLHAHAIGDGAVRQFLDALTTLEDTNGPRDRRPLLAHLEVVDPDDIPRFETLGAYACFQPLWAYPDSYIQELTWPVIGEERSEWLYPIGALADAGATIVAGSDWSVSSMNPFEAIEVAVTRQDPWEEGDEVLTPQHKIDVLRAIRAYTSDAAKASFTEDKLGSLEVGKRADFIRLAQDPFQVSPHELSDILVMETWLEGKQVYQYSSDTARPMRGRVHAHPRHMHERRLRP